MKIKNITIRIKSLEEILEEAKGVMEAIEKGDKVKKHKGISFADIDTMQKILTKERLRILKTIKHKNPNSIYELAKILGRDIKNTYDDVVYLSDMGFIELKRVKEGREKIVPSIPYNEILVKIAV
ncbi:MAG: ArsR family transcriptional regulator [Nitrospirae bacterium]|nr:ArsR family transcriptional regulator [Nitrospirota bacterium]